MQAAHIRFGKYRIIKCIRFHCHSFYQKSMDLCQLLNNNRYKTTYHPSLLRNALCNLITKIRQWRPISYTYATIENPLNCVILPIKFNFVLISCLSNVKEEEEEHRKKECCEGFSQNWIDVTNSGQPYTGHY